MKKFTGGLRWGEKGFFSQKNVSFPMASLWVDPSEVVLKVPTLEFRIPREKILKTGIKKRILYKGIVIEHVAEDVPPIIVFWTRDAEEIVGQL